MASKASLGSDYRSPSIFLSVAAGIATGIAGIWMPVIGLSAGFDGMGVLVNPVWGLAYNVAAGAINFTLGSAPGTNGGLLELFVCALAWPLLVCAAVSYGVTAVQRCHSDLRRIAAVGLFCPTLVIDIPAWWFTSNGPACGFFIYPGLIY